ncbi:hypothetical protein M1413_03050 [Patescibacteria group bacterium]|jgi:uncharacterized protein (UPF0333 family)|nr:hypothetical protein [Patescibacteria group bacterium]MCL5114171.1 hypothetical protein [Patescibacteria group bacterium]
MSEGEKIINWLERNWFRLGVLLILIAIGAAIVYYIAIFLPDRQSQLDQEKKDAVIANTVSRNKCLANAASDYRDLLKENTYSDGTFKSTNAEQYVENKYTDEKDECFKEYPINADIQLPYADPTNIFYNLLNK